MYGTANRDKVNKWHWSVSDSVQSTVIQQTLNIMITQMRMFGRTNQSIFDTIDHDLHRRRRQPWAPFFSKQSVERLQPLIQTKVDKLCERITEYQAIGKPAIMMHAYSSLTADIISDYSYPEGYNFLDQQRFPHELFDNFMSLFTMCHFFKQFNWLVPILDFTPVWLARRINSHTHRIICMREHLLGQAMDVIKRRDHLDFKQSTGRLSLMHAIVISDVAEVDKSAERLAAEAQLAMSAGTLTSSYALVGATYHILANMSVFQRLMDELSKAIPDASNPPPLRTLEQIPYLVAIVQETLRMFPGVAHRLQRIFPDRNLQYKDWCIPSGTPVSMTTLFIHNNPSIYSDPFVFQPERWLPLHTEGQRLQKYFHSFGKGTRQCVGMELGKAEIIMTLANVFRRFGNEMRLFDTVKEKDIDIARDLFIPCPSVHSNGLLVMFEKNKKQAEA